MVFQITVFITVIASFSKGNELSFPKNFKFGLATASYQVEGGWNASGKGESIYDHVTHSHPEWIVDQSNGDIACDSYHLWKDDVQMLKNTGVDYYRFSLSWSRLLPSGFANYINPDAVSYYNNIINELIINDIEPMVTLYHWDLPQSLQDLGGWPNEVIREYFEEYANVAFKLFGDRVKMWITFNEPIEICRFGYGVGLLAPNIKLSGVADYMCGKTLLLSHAKVYHLYNKVYRPQQKGTIGITLSAQWMEPKTNLTVDIEAAERALQMTLGWWAHPIFSADGDYPEVMQSRIGNQSKAENFTKSRLPLFTNYEVELIRGTSDFFGLNHYTTRLASDLQLQQGDIVSSKRDMSVLLDVNVNWKQSAATWLYVVPWGMRKILNWIKKEYSNPVIYITENGYADNGELKDQKRIEYLKDYLNAVLEAIVEDGCNVKKYTAWSLMDNMEWMDGYTLKFGIYHVDFNNLMRTRTPKQSFEYYKSVIATSKP